MNANQMKLLSLLLFLCALNIRPSWAVQCKQLVNQIDGGCVFSYKNFSEECPDGWFQHNDQCEDITSGKVKPKSSLTFAKDFCQVSTMTTKCPTCPDRRAVTCYTEKGIVEGYVNTDAIVSQIDSDGKVVDMNKSLEETLANTPDAEKLQVFSFDPGTNIYSSDEGQKVIFSLSDEKGKIPLGIQDFGRFDSGPYEFRCVSKGVDRKRCMGIVNFPESSRFHNYKLVKRPVIFESAPGLGCDVSTSHVMQVLKEGIENKSIANTAISGNNELVEGSPKPTVKRYKMKMNYSEDEMKYGIPVTYEKNSFYLDSSPFSHLSVGKYQIEALELAEESKRILGKISGDQILKNGSFEYELTTNGFVPDFSGIRSSTLKTLIQNVLIAKYKISKDQAAKLSEGEVEVVPGRTYKSDGKIVTKYNANHVPKFFTDKMWEPVSVCPGAKKWDYFIEPPIEAKTPLCDELVIVGETQNKLGELKMVGCFSSETKNPVYCAKPSDCADDKYSPTHQKFKVEKVISVIDHKKTRKRDAKVNAQ